jgi:hypothetical protein
MFIESYFENWEQRNWRILARLQISWRHRLWRLWKLKKRTFVVLLFLTFLAFKLGFKISALLIGFIGFSELRFSIGPEHPSMAESERNLGLRERVGPSVFLR